MDPFFWKPMDPFFWKPGSIGFQKKRVHSAALYYLPSLVEISPVPGKKIFEGFSPYMGDSGAHLGHVTQMPRTNFRSPYSRMLHINLALIGQSVLEKIIEILDDDGRTPEHGYTISSPVSLWLR